MHRESRVLVFDLETIRTAEEVGGWGHIREMGMSYGAVLSLQTPWRIKGYWERDIPSLMRVLNHAEKVIGFNIKNFDWKVLSFYEHPEWKPPETLDLLQEIHRELGYRVSLDNLAEANLGHPKKEDGLAVVKAFREKDFAKVKRHCNLDVWITAHLYERGRKTGSLLYADRKGEVRRVKASWW